MSATNAKKFNGLVKHARTQSNDVKVYKKYIKLYYNCLLIKKAENVV